MVDFFQEAVRAYEASKQAVDVETGLVFLEQAKVCAALADLQQRVQWADFMVEAVANARATGMVPADFPPFPGEPVPEA